MTSFLEVFIPKFLNSLFFSPCVLHTHPNSILLISRIILGEEYGLWSFSLCNLPDFPVTSSVLGTILSSAFFYWNTLSYVAVGKCIRTHRIICSWTLGIILLSLYVFTYYTVSSCEHGLKQENRTLLPSSQADP